MEEQAAAKLIREEAPNVGTFGSRLKREREKRGITLEDVSASTKIGVRMLRALEEERFAQLPGGIFNKGFVRAYARHLGIDEEQAVADYLEAAGDIMPKAPEAVVEIPPAAAPEDQGEGAARVPWGALAIVLLLTALGLSLWSYYTRQVNRPMPETPVSLPLQPQSGSSNSTFSTSTTPSTSRAVSTSASTASTSLLSLSSSATSAIAGLYMSGGSRVTSGINSGMEPPKSSGMAGAVASAEGRIKNLSLVSQDSKPASDASKEAERASSPFGVLIEAEENSWVSIIADGKLILEGTLIAPAVKLVRGQKQIIVRAVNVGGLNFEFNGKKLPSQGGSGEVKSLIFDSDGLQPAAGTAPN